MLLASASLVSSTSLAGKSKVSKDIETALAEPISKEYLPETPEKNAKWTIMVYMDGDNNLETYALKDLEEMERVGSKNGVNIIVLADTLSLINGTHWYFIGEGNTHIDLENGVHHCDCDAIAGGCPGELNMGDGATLTYFVRTAMAYAPAENYMLVLWDHGGGWYGVCWDDSSELFPGSGRADRLTVDETANALAAAGLGPDGDKLAIIGYDACLNGMIEVAYENRRVADYMLASVTTIPGDGWPYDLFLGALTKEPTMTPLLAGSLVVETYVASYSTCNGYGSGGATYVELSLFDLSRLPALVSAVDSLAEALIPYTEDDSYRGMIESAESQTPLIETFGEAFAFVDLGMYLELLGEKIPELQSLTDAAFALLQDAVVHWKAVTVGSGEPVMRTYGMTIYFTCSWYYLYEDYGYETYEEAEEASALPYYGMDFAIDTDWDE